jgi:hypothetical protein
MHLQLPAAIAAICLSSVNAFRLPDSLFASNKGKTVEVGASVAPAHPANEFFDLAGMHIRIYACITQKSDVPS